MKTNSNSRTRKCTSVIFCLILMLPLFSNLFAALDVIHEIDNNNFTNNSYNSVQPAVATDSGNFTHIVFRTENPDYYKIISYMKMDENGNKIVGNRNIPGSYTDARFPRIAIDNWNDIHVVWYAESTYDNFDYVYYAKLDENGRIIVSPKTISQKDSRNPDIDIDDAGYVHVVWQNLTDNNIYYEMMENNGRELWDNVQVSSSGLARFPSVAGGGSREASIVWEDRRDGINEIYYSMLFDGYNVYGERRLTYTYYALAACNPTIKTDPSNNANFLVVWRDMVGSGFNLMYRKIDYYGTAIIDDKQLLYCTERVSSYFQPFTVDQNGDLHVVGVSQVDPPSIYYNRFDNDGNSLLSQPELISTESVSSRYVLSVTATLSGEKAFIFWSLEYNGQTYLEGLRFTQYGSVSGHVYNEDGIPISGATVKARDPISNDIVGESTTKPDGSYVISNLPPKTYNVVADADGYAPDTQYNVGVNGGEDTPNIDFHLVYVSNTGSISGTIYNEGGESLEGAEVEAYQAGTSNLYGSGFTDLSGKYQIGDLPLGSYDVVASRYGYKEGTQKNIWVNEGEDTPNIDFILPINPGSISGKVTEVDGNTPIPNAEAVIIETEQKTYTNQEGVFLLEGVSLGTYTLKAKKEMYRSAQVSNVIVKPGEVTDVNFMLERTVPPPKNLKVWQGELSGELYIKWDAVTKDTVGKPITVDYYNLYRSTDSGGPYTLVGSTTEPSYIDANLTLGIRYYYVVTAFSQGMESFYSFEASRVPGVRNQPPEAKIVALPTAGQAPLEVQFDGSGSTDHEDGTTLQYSWDFDASDGIRNESHSVNPSHVYEQPGIYIVTLTVEDTMGAKNVTTQEIMVTEIPPPPSPPPESPWSKEPSIYIDIPKDSYASDECIEITVSGYMRGSGVLVIYEKVVDSRTSQSYVEYRECSQVFFDFKMVITIPALPVYNNQEHKVVAQLFSLGDPSRPIVADIKSYSVEYNVCDMIILTNPNSLRSEFSIGNWGDTNPEPEFDNESVLFLIQRAVNDKGILFYTNETSPENIKNQILSMKNDKVNDSNLSILEYLFILGGDEVIPYERFSFLLLKGIRDSIYWDFDGDHYPDIKYARLPTSPLNDYQSNNHFLNYHVVRNVLEEPFDKEINRGFAMIGLLISSLIEDYTNIIEDYTNIIEDKLKKIFLTIYEVSESIFPLGLIAEEYELEDLQESDLLILLGHGFPEKILPFPYVENPPLVLREDSDSSSYGVRFLNEDHLSSGSGENSVQILFNTEKNSNETYRLEGSNRTYMNNKGLNSPVVFSASCSTMNISNIGMPLSFHLMILGSKAFFGYGNTLVSFYMPYGYNKFFDELSPDLQGYTPTIGEIFSNCASHAASETNFLPYPLSGSNLKQSLKGFMVHGYPKLRVKLNNSQSQSKTPSSLSGTPESAPHSIHLLIEDYDILAEDDTFWFSFTGTLNSNPVESEEWILQGNPIIPCIHKVYDVPAGRTVDSLSFTTIQQSIGIYKLQEMPGTYFGELYEHYPLDYTVFMPEPVQWKVIKRIDGNMALEVDIFPFEYHTDTEEIIMHNNINIDITYTDRTAHITNVITNNSLYLSNESVKLTVESTGASELRVTLDGENEITEQSAGTNVFWIEVGDLNPGFHTLEIKSYIGDALMDEETIGFTVTENLVDIGAPLVPQLIKKGTDLQVLIPVMNRDTRPISFNLKLKVSQENYAESTNIGSISLEGEEMKWVSTTISTSRCEQGEIFLRIEGSSEYEFFRSPYGSTFVIAQQAQMQAAPEQDAGIYNKLLRPLSWYNIGKAKSLLEKAYDLLEQMKEKGLDSSECEKWLQEGEELLGEAQEYYTAGNYISANYYANKAIEAIERAIECFEGLLH